MNRAVQEPFGGKVKDYQSGLILLYAIHDSFKSDLFAAPTQLVS